MFVADAVEEASLGWKLRIQELVMTTFRLSVLVTGAALLLAAPAFAQTSPAKQKTDGDSPTMVGPGSKAYKQKTDGDGLTQVGPGSKAYKQKTDGDGLTQVGPGSKAYKQKTDGEGLTQVGPGSKAYKQKTDGDGLTQVGPGSGAYKQRTQSMSHSDGSPVGIAKQN
jgi:hypothetical protein